VKVKITQRILFLSVVGLLVFIGLLEFANQESFPGHKQLKGLLINSLTKYDPLPVASYKSQSNLGNVIYVLGGSEDSLKYRLKTASDLYKDGVANKILIDNDQTMMEYSPALGRNLTFNEWAIERLVGLGVKKENIEPVPIEKGFFGTYSEARSISNIVLNRGYKSLILVSSQIHTMRVWKSFSKFVKNRNINLYIYTSNDIPRTITIFQEYFKLQIYEIFLL